MPYARTDYTLNELIIALANPVHAPGLPHAHSGIHAVSGELASNPLFQRARTTAKIHSDTAKDANLAYHTKELDGSWTYNSATRKAHALPKSEVPRHSTLDVNLLAPALRTALNAPAMQGHLANLDTEPPTEMKVNVNFGATIGQGLSHHLGASVPAQMVSLFVYCKANPGNKDIPIFQTVIPKDARATGGTIVTIP